MDDKLEEMARLGVDTLVLAQEMTYQAREKLKDPAAEEFHFMTLGLHFLGTAVIDQMTKRDCTYGEVADHLFKALEAIVKLMQKNSENEKANRESMI